MIDLFDNDSDSDVRRAAVQTLQRMAEKGYAKPLAKLRQGVADQSWSVRQLTVTAFGQVLVSQQNPAPSDFLLLVRALGDEDSDVVTAGLESLTQTVAKHRLVGGSRQLRTQLLKVLKNSSWSIRQKAVALLGTANLLTAKTISKLLEFWLNETDEDVREKMMEVIAKEGQMSIKPIIDLLEKISESDELSELGNSRRSEIRELMEQIGQPAFRPLMNLAKSKTDNPELHQLIMGMTAKITGYYGQDKKLGQGLGFELEVEFDEGDDLEQIYYELKADLEEKFSALFTIKFDDSLDYGLEIVSMPFTYEHLMKEPNLLPDLCQLLEGYGASIQTTCGLHVHQSSAAISPLTLFKLQNFVYNNIHDLLWLSGRTSAEWTYDFADPTLPVGRFRGLIDRCIPIPKGQGNGDDELSRDKYCADDRGAVNLSGNTVEYRLGAGTLDPMVLEARIQLPYLLISFCQETAINALSWSSFIAFLADQSGFEALRQLIDQFQDNFLEKPAFNWKQDSRSLDIVETINEEIADYFVLTEAA